MIKIMLSAMFVALVTLHVFVDGESLAPEAAYNCYWAIANASDRVCRNHDQDGFYFFNYLSCSARCLSGNIERRLPPGITCDEYHLHCLGDIGQDNKPLICTGCTPPIYDMLSRWQSG
uniref:Putative wc protein n=1 Tax=Ixodes ricinus TaxID=34613 RepID=A0A0K8R631_IXORI